MGLYRTIPTDVEAVQFDGMRDGEPILLDMGPSLPSWLWKAITRGVVSFDSVGVKVNGIALNKGDWIIHDRVFISTMDDKKFSGTFSKARKPSSELVNAAKTVGEKRAAAKAAEVVQPQEPEHIEAVAIADIIPRAVTEAVTEVGAIAPVTNAGVSVSGTHIGLGVAQQPLTEGDVDGVMDRITA